MAALTFSCCGKCVFRSLVSRGNRHVYALKWNAKHCLEYSAKWGQRSLSSPHCNGVHLFSTSSAHCTELRNSESRKTAQLSLEEAREQSLVSLEFAPLQVMPFTITQGGKFVVHLLQRCKPTRAIVLVRNEVLAKELSMELQEYGYHSAYNTSGNTTKNDSVMSDPDLDREDGMPSVVVMTDTELKNVRDLPGADLLIQVQPPSRGPGFTLKLLREAKRRSSYGQACDTVLLYNHNDLRFISQVQTQVEVLKLSPPSFYPVTAVLQRQHAIPHTTEHTLPANIDRSVQEVEQGTPIPPKEPLHKLYHPPVPVPTKKSARSKLNDRVRLYVRGGSGGQGSLSTGGLGGNGGDVILECRQHGTLSHFSVKENRRLLAEHGDHFVKKKRKRRGSRGSDLIVPIPLGTTVTTDDGRLIGDLDTAGTRILVAKGGQGGSPSTVDWNGEKGERHIIRLELKLIADIGLIGFPNAGKSTLLGALSRAKPKTADYPFTTIRPTIGIVEYPDFTQVSVADMPGLLEGAFMNKGMGHRFLKHTERTQVLALVVDVNGFQLSAQSPHRTAFQAVCVLLKELALYEPCTLLSRPKVLILNKMDCDKAQHNYEALLRQLDSMEKHGSLLAVLEEIETTQNLFSPGGIYQLREHPELSHIKFRDVIPISAINSVGLDNVREIFREVIL